MALARLAVLLGSLATMSLVPVGLGTPTARAQDDWEISRDPEPRPGRPGGVRRPRRPRPAGDASAVEARMIERYVDLVLARPDDESAVRRLLERASRRPGGVEAVVRDLEARRADLGVRAELALAALSLARSDVAAARAAIDRALAIAPESVPAYLLRARIELAGLAAPLC
jgi:hypothetical protein